MIEATCQRCQRIFRTYPSRISGIKGAVYCSKECRHAVSVERRSRPLTAERARELLIYDSETGAMMWNIHIPWHKIAPGDKAGYVASTKSGLRRKITIDGNEYLTNRVIWLLYYGKWPEGCVDHKDTDTLNECIDNLRDATNGQNRANSRILKPTTTGLKGVRTFAKSKKFWAYITIDKKNKCLGGFATPEEAHAAYLAASYAAKGEFTRG